MKTILEFIVKHKLNNAENANKDAAAEQECDKTFKDYTLKDFLNGATNQASNIKIDAKVVKRVLGKFLKDKDGSGKTLKFADGYLHIHIYYDPYSDHGALFSKFARWPKNEKDWDNCAHSEGTHKAAPQTMLIDGLLTDLNKQVDKLYNNQIS